MPKINTSVLPRPETISETRDFADPLAPGLAVHLTLASRPDYSQELDVQAKGAQNLATYGGKGKVPIQAGGKDIAITPGLCMAIGLLQSLELPQEDGSGVYSFQEYAQMSVVLPNAFADIVTWAYKILDAHKKAKPAVSSSEMEPQIPEVLAAHEAATSAPPPNTTPIATPT